MPNPIKPKRSYTTTNTPTLSAGELGLNATDGKIWIGNAAGNANVLVVSKNTSDLVGTISNAQIANAAVTNLSGTNTGDGAANSSATFIGTTSVALNRTSAALTLAGITLTTPSLGTPTTLILTNATGLPLTTGVTGILPTANGGTGSAFFTAAGPTIARIYTFPDAAATIARTDAAQTFTGVQTISSQPILSSLTVSSAVATDASKGLVSVTNTGTGNNVLATSPTLVTPNLGTPTSGTLTNCTFPTLNQNTSGRAAIATNIAGGLGGLIHYQSAVNTTALLANGTAGQSLQANGTTVAPSWVTPATVPTGSLMPYAGSAAPSGYLLCDGSAVSRTTYAALFAVTATTYGVGDNSTTFNLPDLRSRTIVGVGQGSGLTNRALASTVGAENIAIGETNLPTHTHSFTPAGTLNTESAHTHTSANAGSHNHTSNNSLLMYVGSGGGANLNAGTSYQIYNLNATIQNNGDHSHGATTGNSGHTHSFTGTLGTTGNGNGTGATLTNMQPSISLNYIIKI